VEAPRLADLPGALRLGGTVSACEEASWDRSQCYHRIRRRSRQVRYGAFLRVSVPGPDPTGGCGVDGCRDADHPLPLPLEERCRVGL
jgi:hypothetical protein